MANNVNGMAKANENPNMPMMGFRNTPWDEAIKIEPASGPVQENDTKTNVNAMKNTPNNPPLSDFASTLLTRPEGRTISNAPRKEIPKSIKMTKNNRFGIQ